MKAAPKVEVDDKPPFKPGDLVFRHPAERRAYLEAKHGAHVPIGGPWYCVLEQVHRESAILTVMSCTKNSGKRWMLRLREAPNQSMFADRFLLVEKPRIISYHLDQYVDHPVYCVACPSHRHQTEHDWYYAAEKWCKVRNAAARAATRATVTTDARRGDTHEN